MVGKEKARETPRSLHDVSPRDGRGKISRTFSAHLQQLEISFSIHLGCAHIALDNIEVNLLIGWNYNGPKKTVLNV
jgi:hypothetical protein